MILGIETSCDETAAAVVTEDGGVLSSVVSSQAELHARFGGVVPEVASRRHLELVAPVVREALDVASVPLDRIERVAVTQGPGLVGALLVGISGREGARVGARAAARPGRPPRGARRVALPRAGSARAAVHLPARERRAHAAPRRPRARELRSGSARRSTTPRARRSTRAPGCSASAIRAARRSTGSRATATRRVRLPGRARARASTSRSPGSRPRCSTPSATSDEAEVERRRADLAASYQRAIVRALVQRCARRRATGRARADRGRRRRRRELRSCAPRFRRDASRRSSSARTTPR